MRTFKEVATEYHSLHTRITEMKPEVKLAALTAYKTGMRVQDIAHALDMAIPTFYVWLREAKEPAQNRHSKRSTSFDVAIVDNAADVDFGWFEGNVRVDRNGVRVFIDPDRVNFTGDRSLGQLLVSGTDKDLIDKFNDFLEGN